MVGEVQTLDTSELGLDYRLSRKHKIHNVWKTRKSFPQKSFCFILVLLNVVPDYFHYCITVAIVLWISLSPLINIIVIVYYADQSCDMQEQELLPSHWSEFLAPSSDWLIWVSAPGSGCDIIPALATLVLGHIWSLNALILKKQQYLEQNKIKHFRIRL